MIIRIIRILHWIIQQRSKVADGPEHTWGIKCWLWRSLVWSLFYSSRKTSSILRSGKGPRKYKLQSESRQKTEEENVQTDELKIPAADDSTECGVLDVKDRERDTVSDEVMSSDDDSRHFGRQHDRWSLDESWTCRGGRWIELRQVTLAGTCQSQASHALNPHLLRTTDSRIIASWPLCDHSPPAGH